MVRTITALKHLLACASLCVGAMQAFAQPDIEDVLVEVYYVSDNNDATDETGGFLAPGSRTYRVFIDLCTGCSMRALYGDSAHPLLIRSTAPFFNNIDRGRTYGHQIANGALDENTAALDSWLTLGAASNQRAGIPKVNDSDGSIIGGVNNDGGSAAIPGGLLVNTDPLAGIPLVQQDGLVPSPTGPLTPPNFNTTGDDPAVVFFDASNDDTFLTSDFRMGCSTPGVAGPTEENLVLLAQLTTIGELSFTLNVEVQRPDGSIARYVGKDTLLNGEVPNGLLNYPPTCGCTDPDFLEYDPAAGCDDGSCATPIVFGCLDPEACNFSSTANFNVPQLCCYDALNCNGLDVELVCPQLSIEEQPSPMLITVFPNPTNGPLRIIASGVPDPGIEWTLRDLLGRSLATGYTRITQGAQFFDITLEDLPVGTYSIEFRTEHHRTVSRIMKS